MGFGYLSGTCISGTSVTYVGLGHLNWTWLLKWDLCGTWILKVDFCYLCGTWSLKWDLGGTWILKWDLVT